MTTFALVTEGLTDQPILERMIEQICGRAFDDGVEINPLQPLRDATDTAASTPHAGWELVLEFCRGERVADALSANDYIIIHLDTDQGDHPNFGVPLTHHGADRNYIDLIGDAIAVITSHLGSVLYSKHAKRFLFAISVHSMESWILLCIFGRNEPKNSAYRLNRRLSQAGREPLLKDVRAYSRIARDIKRDRLVKLVSARNSLGHFLGQLASLCATATESSTKDE